MKITFIAPALCLLSTAALAADPDIGKTRALQLCAACHGANGVSVADHIPNLAGQRAGYIAAQLRAFRSGARKHDVMGAVAAQLDATEIVPLAGYYAAQAAAALNAKSAFLPNLARSNATLPPDYPAGFSKYHTQNVPDSRQVKVYFANAKARSAAQAGKPLPDGAAVVVQVHAAKLDAEQKPVVGEGGLFVAERLLAYTVMAREAGWGKDFPAQLRNEDWNYALFSADRQPRAGINQAECLACHKPVDASSYVFTLKEMAAH